MNDSVYFCVRDQLRKGLKSVPTSVFHLDKRKGAQMLRKKLKCSKHGLIPFNRLPDIERLLNTRLTVCGDIDHRPTLDPVRFRNHVKLKVKDGSCTVRSIKSNQLTKAAFPEHVVTGCSTPAETLEYEQQAEELKSHGFDLLKHGPKQLGLLLFHRYNSMIDDPEPIEKAEEEWVNLATMGALQYSRAGDYQGCWAYDANSHYPSILQAKNFILPYGKPAFQSLTSQDISRFVPFGIYRASIEHRHVGAVFKYNANDTYTSIDLEHARELGLDIKLKHFGGMPNAMLYTGMARMPSFLLFNKLFKKLYALRAEGVAPKYTKVIMNKLWGSLVQQHVHISKGEEELPADTVVEGVTPDGTVRYTRTSEPFFKTNYGRFKPFILAQGRYALSRVIRAGVPELSRVVRVHTDGFMVHGGAAKDIPIGAAMGEYKVDLKNQHTVIESLKAVYKFLED